MYSANRGRDWFGFIVKTFIGLIALLILVGIFGQLAGCGPGMKYSEGTRSGVVYKLSKKGFMYTTWEGELSLGMNERDADGAIIPRVFAFSVSSEDVVKQLQEAERSGKRVTLHYIEYRWRGISHGETPYDIIKVEQQ